MRMWIWLIFAAAACLAAQDPRAIMEKSLQREQRDDELASQYTYLETTAQQEWKNGQRTRTEIRTYEVLSLYGQPYRRLVAKDGKPLSTEEQGKEQAKMDKLAAERARESAQERAVRVAKSRENRQRQRAFLQKIPQAFALQLAGETRIGDRPAWMIDATPLASFRPNDARERMLTKFKGRFYVAKQDSTLLKLEAEAIDTVSFGLVLARLDRGARFSLEKTLINNELWMPARIKVDFEARLALLKKMKVDLQIDYSGFRKFVTDSKVLPAGDLGN